MSEEQQQFSKIVKFLSRNLRPTLVCLLCSLIAGLVWYLRSPKVYKSSALIMYELQQVNPTKMSPDVQTRLQEMVNTVAQQVTSLSNLEEIVVAHGLYPDMQRKLPMVDVVVSMRNEHIKIEPKTGTNVFSVSFEGDDPRQVMLTANSLAAKFIEENIRYREQRAKSTSTYVKDELDIIKVSLDKQEQSMRDYKLQYFNEMPEQRLANINRLSSLETQYQEIQNSLQDLKRTQILIQEQITMRKDLLSRLGDGQGGFTPGLTPPSELARVQQELEMLRSRYTENHPDVKRLQGRLAVLLKEQADSGGEPKLPGAAPQDSQLGQLGIQLKEIDISMARLNREQAETRQQIGRVKRWVETTPVREAEWAALTRDYSQLQQHYQALVARNLEADSAELLEQRQKGSQFKIIEPAILPSMPFRPSFPKIMSLAAIIGLGLGLGLGAAKAFLDTSFKGVEDLESYLGLPVTCAIPEIQTAGEKKLRRRNSVIWAAALGTGYTALILGLLLLWWKGRIII